MSASNIEKRTEDRDGQDKDGDRHAIAVLARSKNDVIHVGNENVGQVIRTAAGELIHQLEYFEGARNHQNHIDHERFFQHRDCHEPSLLSPARSVDRSGFIDVARDHFHSGKKDRCVKAQHLPGENESYGPGRQRLAADPLLFKGSEPDFFQKFVDQPELGIQDKHPYGTGNDRRDDVGRKNHRFGHIVALELAIQHQRDEERNGNQDHRADQQNDQRIFERNEKQLVIEHALIILKTDKTLLTDAGEIRKAIINRDPDRYDQEQRIYEKCRRQKECFCLHVA